MGRLSRMTMVLVALGSSAAACGGEHPPINVQRRHEDIHARQQSGYPTGPAYDVPPLASITPTPVTYTENLLPVIQTYAPGSQPPISGAPPLPTYTIVPTQWPDLSLTPPTNSPEVQEWLHELEGHTIPNIPVNADATCGGNPTAVAAAGSSGNCWWTCGGCTRDTDITQCKNEWEWGHTYDDGPGFYTNKLLTYLNSLSPNGESEITGSVAPGIKATFFVVGARVISRPEIVVYEYMNNHEISIHTWSHSALTTLTNEQIVAELGWTRKAIRDVIGVTPLTFRPPYGDIDDRVRAIALAMGMRPVIWTGSREGVPSGGDSIQWDSQDWRVHAGTVQPVPNQATFQGILDSSAQFANSSSASYSSTMQGVVVLQHDIYVESVNLAIGYTVPFAMSHNPQFKLSTVTECQPRSDGSGKNSLRDAYAETNTDFGNPAWVALMSGNDNNGTGVHMSTSVIQSGGVTRTVTYALSSGTGTNSPNSSSANGAMRIGGGGASLVAAVVGVVGFVLGSLVL